MTAYVKMLILWLNFCIKQLASKTFAILKYIHNSHFFFFFFVNKSLHLLEYRPKDVKLSDV